MSHDWVENEIVNLFQALRQRDERLAPSFPKVWEAAADRTRKAPRSWRGLRAAARTTAVLAVLGVAAAIFRYPAAPPSSLAISYWQSPTDFLLHSPGELWLRTVPRIGESLAKIKAVSSDKKNGGSR